MPTKLELPIRQLPANFGPLKGAHANARVLGPCGDTMEIVESGDTGKPFANRFTESASARAFDQIVRGILSALKDTQARTQI